MRQDRGVSGDALIYFIDHPTTWRLCESSILPGVFRAFRGSKLPRLVARPSGRNHRRGRRPFDKAHDQDHPASYASNVEYSFLNNVRLGGLAKIRFADDESLSTLGPAGLKRKRFSPRDPKKDLQDRFSRVNPRSGTRECSEARVAIVSGVLTGRWYEEQEGSPPRRSEGHEGWRREYFNLRHLRMSRIHLLRLGAYALSSVDLRQV